MIIIDKFSANENLFLEAFLKGDLREDHFSGKNAIYQYSAVVKNIYGKPIIVQGDHEETERNLNILWKLLRTMKIVPDQVFVYEHDDWIHLTFGGRGVVMENKFQYFAYSLEFARYIDSIDFSDMKVSTGSLLDDPVEIEFFKEGGRIESKIAESFEKDFSRYPTTFVEYIDMR